MITTLIDKQDNFEIIRDRIAAILVTEVANQIQLATDASKNPDDWKLRVYTERSNPWEYFLNEQTDRSPIVNVWYDNSSYSGGNSNISERQYSEATYNIDCYGFGMSKDNGSGHIPGDQEAAFESQRSLRLIRNILMSAEYTYLSLRGLVWQRWVESVKVFQPSSDSKSIQQMVGARLSLRVAFNEFSPQVEPVELDLISVDVIRKEDGEILLEADYDYTGP